MNFGQAIEIMKKGGTVKRKWWASAVIRISGYGIPNRTPKIIMWYQEHGRWNGYLPTTADVIGEDWEDGEDILVGN
jgi:hypothetical protein